MLGAKINSLVKLAKNRFLRRANLSGTLRYIQGVERSLTKRRGKQNRAQVLPTNTGQKRSDHRPERDSPQGFRVLFAVIALCGRGVQWWMNFKHRGTILGIKYESAACLSSLRKVVLRFLFSLMNYFLLTITRNNINGKCFLFESTVANKNDTCFKHFLIKLDNAQQRVTNILV